MISFPVKNISIICVLLLATACGEKHSNSEAPAPRPVVPKVRLVGAPDNDLKGGWETCAQEGEGSHLLSYTFENEGLILKDSYDPINPSCESPALVTTYRFAVQRAEWVSRIPLQRTMSAELKQVTTSSSAKQVISLFNRDAQCGITDWIVKEERDITGLLCLGVEDHAGFALGNTNPMPFVLQLTHQENDIILTADKGFKSLFIPQQIVKVSDGRDLRVMFWNNELPPQAKRSYSLNFLIPGKTYWDGEGYFVINRSMNASEKVSVKKGLMTFTLEIPDVTPPGDIFIMNGYFRNTSTNEIISFFLDQTTGVMTFRNPASIKIMETPASGLIFHIPANTLADTTAPSFELLQELPATISRKTDLDFRIKAADDLAGIHEMALYAENLQGALPAQLTYEGRGIYRVRSSPANYSFIKKLTALAVIDRVGNISEQRAIAIQIVD